MYPVILKEGRDLYAILDVHFKGIWKFEKKYLLIYLSLLKARLEVTADKFDEGVFASAQVAGGAKRRLVRDVLDFVAREKMPLLCNFEPDYLSSFLDEFDNGIITPPTPVVEVTSLCNYRCPWCYIPGDAKNQKGITALGFEQDLVQPMVSKFGLLTWCLTGGEPALDIAKTIKFADIINQATQRVLGRRPSRITLLTNGYNLEQNAERLLGAGINNYQITLISPDPKKDAALRRPIGSVNSYQHSVDGIKRLKALGASVEVNMVVQPRNAVPCSNIDDIEAMFDLAHDLRIDRLRIIPAAPCGRAFENGIFFTREEYDQIRRCVQDLRPKVENEMIVDCPIDKEIEPDRSIFCGAATLWLYVNHIGETFPCNNLQCQEARCSDGLGRSLADVWTDSKVLKSMRNYGEASLHEDCIGCNDRVICAGDCRALCYARYKKFNLAFKPQKCFKFQ